MTDTHKDLVKHSTGNYAKASYLRLAERMRDRDYLPSAFERTQIIERLTASAPVDGDLREKIARTIFHSAVGERQWDNKFYEDEKNGCFDCADTILALLPARTPETDADVVLKVADSVKAWSERLGKPRLFENDCKSLARHIVEANLLRAPAVDAERRQIERDDRSASALAKIINEEMERDQEGDVKGAAFNAANRIVAQYAISDAEAVREACAKICFRKADSHDDFARDQRECRPVHEKHKAIAQALIGASKAIRALPLPPATARGEEQEPSNKIAAGLQEAIGFMRGDITGAKVHFAKDAIGKVFEQLLDDAEKVGVKHIGLLIGPCVRAMSALRNQPSPSSPSAEYVVRKRGLFYRENSRGYTRFVEEAGRYTKEAAERCTSVDPKIISAHHISEFTAAPRTAQGEPCGYCNGSGDDQNHLNDPGPCHHCEGTGVVPAATSLSPQAGVSEPTVEQTIEFIKKAHAGQVDKGGEEYWKHPVAVMGLIEKATDHEKIVALLHDILEDTETKPIDLLKMGYPFDVVWDVNSITKHSKAPYHIWIETIAMLGTASAIRVKMADLTHNLLPERRKKLPEELSRRLAQKYRTAWLMLKDELARRSASSGVAEK